MKKFYTLIISSMLLLNLNIFGQTVINEKFDGTVFPPAGWSIDSHSANWSAKPSNNASGDAPEARFSWSPQFNGISRLISSPVDLTGVQNLAVEFKHSIDHYGGSYTVGIATKSGGGAWNDSWRISNPTSSVPGERIRMNITSDLNTSDFQICWYFSGDSYNINYWYLDDIRVYIPFDHDVATDEVLIEKQYTSGQSFAPGAKVVNLGLNTESFDVTCEIFEGSTSVYTDTKSVTSLDAGLDQTVTFSSFTPSTSDELYKVYITTQLPGDLDTSNDTTFSYFDTNTNPRIVLWEEFTSTTCAPCGSANPTIEQMLTDYGEDVILAVWYHVWWPSPGNDPYYAANTADSRARTTDYYGINAVPDAVVDGNNGPSPGNLGSMQAAVNARRNIFSPFNLTAGFVKSDNDVSMHVSCEAVGGVIPGNIKTRIVAVENGLDYTAPNGETHFNHVMRKMYPSPDGTELNISKGQTVTTDVVCTVDTAWDEANTDFIVFIQNDDTKEILQVCKAVYNPNVPVELTSFTAAQTGHSIKLEWTTATETNNHGFVVERKQVTDNNEGTWTKLGFKEGQGTSASPNTYMFMDDLNGISEGSVYYRLIQIDYDGARTYSDEIFVNGLKPFEYALHQNYPNPFNPSTTIKYELPESGIVSLIVYDVLGREVSTLINSFQESGRYSAEFNAEKLGSGIYFYRLDTPKFHAVKKMMLIK